MLRRRREQPEVEASGSSDRPTAKHGTAAPSASSGAASDDVPSSDWVRIGRLGMWYLVRNPKWIRRHVETVKIKNLLSARRQLTIDLALPDDPAAIAETRGDCNLYFVPAFRLVKSRGRSYMDLENESGRSLPLFTRRENAMITLAAVAEAGHALMDGPPTRRLFLAWRELVYGAGGLEGQLYFKLVEALMEEHHPAITAHPNYEPFVTFLRDLSENAVVWVPLVGRPRERRIIKLRYDTPTGPSQLRPKRGGTFYVRVEADGEARDFELEEQGDSDFRSAVSRVVERIYNSLGLTPMGILLRTPYIEGSDSYHLQVEAPAGVEIRRITLLAKLRDGDPNPVVGTDRDSAHLYLQGAKVIQIAPALMLFRVGRRGFLSLSAISALVIGGILWAFDAAAPLSQAGTRSEVATAVLLAAPALLLAFAMPPQGEHEYPRRLLVGVRGCMLLLGMLAVADAAAIAEVR